MTIDGVAHLGFVDAALMLAPVPGITGTRGTHGPRLTARATVLFGAAIAAGQPVDPDDLAEVGAIG